MLSGLVVGGCLEGYGGVRHKAEDFFTMDVEEIDWTGILKKKLRQSQGVE